MNYFDFFNNHWILTLQFVSILILIIINELYISRYSKRYISIESAVDMINHKNAKIFDIRIFENFQKGYIKNSININIENISKNKYVISKHKKNIIILCSDVKKNTSKMTEILKKHGFKKVYVLKGGIQSWKNAGFPLITTVKKIHLSNKK